MTQKGWVNTRLDKHSNKQRCYDPASHTSTLGATSAGRNNGAKRPAQRGRQLSSYGSGAVMPCSLYGFGGPGSLGAPGRKAFSIKRGMLDSTHFSSMGRSRSETMSSSVRGAGMDADTACATLAGVARSTCALTGAGMLGAADNPAASFSSATLAATAVGSAAGIGVSAGMVSLCLFALGVESRGESGAAGMSSVASTSAARCVAGRAVVSREPRVGAGPAVYIFGGSTAWGATLTPIAPAGAAAVSRGKALAKLAGWRRIADAEVGG